MRDDLITVVTGEPRSGTSLQMQSLHLLGVPVAGKEFPVAGGKLDRSAVADAVKKASLTSRSSFVKTLPFFISV